MEIVATVAAALPFAVITYLGSGDIFVPLALLLAIVLLALVRSRVTWRTSTIGIGVALIGCAAVVASLLL